MIVYKLTFASGKSYIGQTEKTLHHRITQHRRVAKQNSQLAVHCAWREYGEPVVSVLATCETHEQMHALEIQMIRDFNTLSPSGYNICLGGKSIPSKMPDVAKKISDKAKGRKSSDQTKEKVSAGSIKNWQIPEYREKVLAAQRVAMTKPEVSEKMSANMKARWERRKADGWVMPQEHRDSLAARPIDDEWRKNMSEAAKKRIRTPVKEETCVKLSGNAKAQHASRTPEQKAAIAEKIRQSNKARYAAMTPEQYEAFCELRKKAGQVRRANRLAAITQSPDNSAS